MAASPTAGVPLCDIQAQFRELRPQFEAALARVLESGQVILGPEVAALEEEVARYCGRRHGVGCGSGTDALSLALHALEIGPGDEVILPTFTFFATAGAVCRTGAKPVFVDIDPSTYNLDPFQVESKITPRTRAVLVGPPVRPVRRHGAAVERGGTARPDHRRGRGPGARRRSTRASGPAAWAAWPASASIRPKTSAASATAAWSSPAIPAGRSAWRACASTAWSRSTITSISAGTPGWTPCRRPAARQGPAPGPLDRGPASGGPSLRRADRGAPSRPFPARPVVRPQRRHTFNQYVVRVADGQRDALVQRLKAERIGCEIYYPVPLHLQECLAYLGHRAGEFPGRRRGVRRCAGAADVPGNHDRTAEPRRRQLRRLRAAAAPHGGVNPGAASGAA